MFRRKTREIIFVTKAFLQFCGSFFRSSQAGPGPCSLAVLPQVSPPRRLPTSSGAPSSTPTFWTPSPLPNVLTTRPCDVLSRTLSRTARFSRSRWEFARKRRSRSPVSPAFLLARCLLQAALGVRSSQVFFTLPRSSMCSALLRRSSQCEGHCSTPSCRIAYPLVLLGLVDKYSKGILKAVCPKLSVFCKHFVLVEGLRKPEKEGSPPCRITCVVRAPKIGRLPDLPLAFLPYPPQTSFIEPTFFFPCPPSTFSRHLS